MSASLAAWRSVRATAFWPLRRAAFQTSRRTSSSALVAHWTIARPSDRAHPFFGHALAGSPPANLGSSRAGRFRHAAWLSREPSTASKAQRWGFTVTTADSQVSVDECARSVSQSWGSFALLKRSYAKLVCGEPRRNVAGCEQASCKRKTNQADEALHRALSAGCRQSRGGQGAVGATREACFGASAEQGPVPQEVRDR